MVELEVGRWDAVSRQIRLSPVVVEASNIGVGCEEGAGCEEGVGYEEGGGCTAGDWFLSKSFTCRKEELRFTGDKSR